MFVPIEYTTAGVKGHEQLYRVFHAWAKEQKHFAEARGWAQTTWSGRVRLVNESNAKGAKESPGIMGVNHKIQGGSADITKAALVAVYKIINSPKWQRDIPEYRDVVLIGQIHDEILFEGPGNLTLDLGKSKYKNGVLVKPHWHVPKSVFDWVTPLRQAMIDAETMCFNGKLIGRAGDPAISQFWSKD